MEWAPSGGDAGRVLVCEDTDHIRELIRLNLQCEGYEVLEAADGVEAIDLLRSMVDDPSVGPLPDVVTVDALMPRRDGWWTVQMIRADPRLEHLPIVMVTASVQPHHRVQAEQAQVDGFIGKPFEPDELVARIRARVRRAAAPTTERLSIGDLRIDVDGHEVRRGDRVIPLTPLEFDLLVQLARKPWQVFTREALLRDVWGYRHSADTRLVNVHVQRLRSKIEHDPENPEIILTVRGVGYKTGKPGV